jgi:hypothetical protein
MKTDKRKQRLIELIKRMDDGLDVSTRDMKIILTDEQHDEYLQMWDSEKEKRNPVKPKSVIEYEKLINQWHMAEARLSKYRERVNKNPDVFQKLVNSIDGYLENIQEYLMEQRHDSEFNSWLDRNNRASSPNDIVDCGSPSNSLDTPPRVITSRSLAKQSSGFLSPLSKRDIKKIVLENALTELDESSTALNMDDIQEQFKRNTGTSIDKNKFKGFKV